MVSLVWEINPGRILIGCWAGMLWMLGRLGMLHWRLPHLPGLEVYSRRVSIGAWKMLAVMFPLSFGVVYFGVAWETEM